MQNIYERELCKSHVSIVI